MNHVLRITLPLLLPLFLIVGIANGEVSVGDTFPSFKLKGSDGKTYSNELFEKNDITVIAWFPKAFTGGCTKECKSLREHGDKLRTYDVSYFTASCDTPEKNTDFAKSLDLDYPILSDPEKLLATQLGCLNPRGMSNRWTYYVGSDGEVLHIDKAVKAAVHGETIAKQLKELGISPKG